MSFKENTAYPAASYQLTETLAAIYSLCPQLKDIIREASDYSVAFEQIKRWTNQELRNNIRVQNFLSDSQNQKQFNDIFYPLHGSSCWT